MDALSIRGATLVGHSMGSFVARQVAIAHPERVDRLVLIDSGWSTRDNAVLPEVEQSLRELSDPVPLEFAREFQASTIHKPIPEDFFEGLLAESLKLPARLWTEVFQGIMAYDDRADLGRITAPTLLLWGEHDGLFPREDQERLVKAIPRATLKIYPDLGHCPNWEAPEQVAADLTAFVRSR
jgi:pimeloyl-ACP methyl ester carboxylesterase